ncbi:MAG: hypothetical protein ACKOU7_04940 [Ferruginibacter sp.]
MKLIFALFIFCSLDVFGQDGVNNVQSILSAADSVVIVQHETLLVSGKPGKPSTTKEIIVNGKPNYSIIIKSIKLDRAGTDSLAVILTKEIDGDIVTMSCFEPHHAVYIFKNNTLSYLDICFGCRIFSHSEDINTGGHKLTNETWFELESFFKTRQFETKFSFR